MQNTTTDERNYWNQERLGTSRWADPEEVARLYPYKDGDFWLGRLITPDKTPIGYNDDRHICLVSGTRGGKGTTSIINNLCSWQGSSLIIDPKGENAIITAARRGKGSEHVEGMGQDVYVLAPMSKEGEIPEEYRASFNPLDALDPQDEQTIDEAGQLADAIVVSGNSDDPFWEESARNLIKGLILYVLTSTLFKSEERNLVTVRKLVLRGFYKKELLGDEYKDVSPYKLLFANMRRNKGFGGIQDVVIGVGESFSHMAEKQLSGILQTANTNTEFLDSTGMQRCLQKTNFKISELKTSEKGVTLYLTLPQRYMNTHFRWLRMMTALTITEMEKVKGQPRTGHPILMVLDEFAGLKRMQIIENAISQMAGYGLKMFYILQSLPQLKALYQDNWETFLTNAGLKMFFAVDDQFTREWASNYAGETEIIRYAESHSTQESSSESITEGTQSGWSKSKGRSFSKGKNQGSSFTPEWFFFDKTSRGTGTNQGRGRNVGTSKSGGTSESRATSTGSSETSGRSETIHKRPLITPDEVGINFSRVDDKTDLKYPGFALIFISGQYPIALRKSYYFEDPLYLGLFSPHPDHKFVPTSLQRELFEKQKELDFARSQVNDIEDQIEAAKNDPKWKFNERVNDFMKKNWIHFVIGVWVFGFLVFPTTLGAVFAAFGFGEGGFLPLIICSIVWAIFFGVRRKVIHLRKTAKETVINVQNLEERKEELKNLRQFAHGRWYSVKRSIESKMKELEP